MLLGRCSSWAAAGDNCRGTRSCVLTEKIIYCAKVYFPETEIILNFLLKHNDLRAKSGKYGIYPFKIARARFSNKRLT